MLSKIGEINVTSAGLPHAIHPKMMPGSMKTFLNQ
jgi:hypothetical protein